MSHHKVEVVSIPSLRPHPGADTLSLVEIWGYQVVVKTEMWKEGDLAAFVEPDYEVPTSREEFSFLASSGEYARVKVARLRGEISQGLLIPAPAGSSVGDCVLEKLGVRRYSPPEDAQAGGDTREGSPLAFSPNYDLEAWHRYPTALGKADLWVVREKVHGSSARFVSVEKEGEEPDIWIGSRTRWVVDDGKNPWSRAYRSNPWIRIVALANPGVVFYGEVYGLQNLRYGKTGGELGVVLFDALRGGKWLTAYEWSELRATEWIKMAPLVYCGKPVKPEALLAMAEGSSLLFPGHIREGVVVQDGFDSRVLAVTRKLKVVGNGYLSLKGRKPR